MAGLKTGTTIAGQTAWHTGNDGPGSGLDADMVDGKHASAFAATVSTTAPDSPAVGQLWIKSNDTTLFVEDDFLYPTLINGWTNYDSAGWGPARYFRLVGGIVTIEGLIKGTNNTVAFVLPVGFRPAWVQHRPAMSYPNFHGTVHVYSDGSVVPYTPNGDTAVWISINTTFFADQ